MSEPRRDSWTISDLRRDYARYSAEVNAADLKPTTKTTYLSHADRFVRWLAGDVVITPKGRHSG